MSEAVDPQTQQTVNEVGMSIIEFESDWWGDNLLGVWTDEVWAVVDDMSGDALHLAVAYSGIEPPEEIRPYDDDWHFDEWVPKSKSEIITSPDWTRFEGDGTRRGTVYAALKSHTKYGWKVTLWGDTYECLSGGEHDALGDVWEQLHPDFNGDWWTVDEVNGVLISKITDAGYDLRVSEGLTN